MFYPSRFHKIVQYHPLKYGTTGMMRRKRDCNYNYAHVLLGLLLLTISGLYKSCYAFTSITPCNHHYHHQTNVVTTAGLLRSPRGANHNYIVWKNHLVSDYNNNKKKNGCLTKQKHHETTTRLDSVLNPTVLVASFSATAKLLSSIGLGAALTPAGPAVFGRVLDKAAVSSLSKLTYWLFQPCFLFCGVAATLAKATTSGVGGGGLPRSSLLLMSLASMLQILLGSIIGKVITTKRLRNRLLGIDPNDDETANNIKMCTTFANSGPLPLILSEALFGRGTKNGAILTDVTACVSFYLLMWSPLFWTFGRNVLGTSSKNGGGIMKHIKSFISPPVMGSILGVVVGSNALLRKSMLTSKGILAPLHGAMATFGSAYLPAAILVLAGSLVKSNDETTKTKKNSSNDSLHPKTVMSLLLSRFILSPLMAMSIVRLLSWVNLLPVQNPRTLAILTFTLLMEGCMPPAQNSVIILQLDGKTDRAAKMAKILTVMYSFSALPVTLLLGWCLNASGILNF